MGQILIRVAEDFPWQIPSDRWPGKVATDAPQVKFRTLCDVTTDPLEVTLVEYEPGHHEVAHSHDTTEVIYILRGEIDLGGRMVRAGSAVVIEKNTTYGPLEAGAVGAQFLRVAGFGS